MGAILEKPTTVSNFDSNHLVLFWYYFTYFCFNTKFNKNDASCLSLDLILNLFDVLFISLPVSRIMLTANQPKYDVNFNLTNKLIFDLTTVQVAS